MMDDKEVEELRHGFIGVWDFIGRNGPKLFNEIKTLRATVAACAAKGCPICGRSEPAPAPTGPGSTNTGEVKDGQEEGS
jgi:hypothetical protein